jgi:hypothetical protein
MLRKMPSGQQHLNLPRKTATDTPEGSLRNQRATAAAK